MLFPLVLAGIYAVLLTLELVGDRRKLILEGWLFVAKFELGLLGRAELAVVEVVVVVVVVVAVVEVVLAEPV